MKQHIVVPNVNMNTNITNKLEKERGFSIMEVMVSAFVLFVGLTAVLTLMAANIKNSIGARDIIIASELAQEGIELVRNVRDNNFVNDINAFDIPFPTECTVDHPFNRIDYIKSYECITYDDDPGYSNNDFLLKYDSNGYGYGSGIVTKFARGIKIEDYSADGIIEKKVKSFVAWGGENYKHPMSPGWSFSYLPYAPYESECTLVNKCIMVEDILTDWAN